MMNSITKHLKVISSLIFFLVNVSVAQNAGKISGVVKDSETGEPLIGCSVILQGTKLGATTDLEGNYFILNVAAGKYNLQSSMIGYLKEIQTDVIVNSGKTTVINFKLKQTAIQQETIVIKATRPDVELEKTSTSTVIRSDEVQQIAGMRDVGDVIGLAADVMDGHFRGGRANEELYVLQGMGITNPLDNSRAITPIMSAVEEVEVVTSGFGAQYGNAQSGVINISMKEGKSDKWRTYAELRVRTPGLKHYGSNVYDVNSNAYLKTLSDISYWKKYYSSVISNQLGRDTALQIAVAQAIWKNARRGMNQSYGDQIDNSGEVSLGGPLSENSRMFLAFSNNTEWPMFPTEHPNVDRQVMGNIVFDVGKGGSLRLSGAYAQANSNVYGTGSFYSYFWNLVQGIQYNTSSNLQLGLRYAQALSPETFYEIKLNMLSLRNKRGSTPFVTDSLINSIINTSWLGKPNTEPDYFEEATTNSSFSDTKTITYSLDASFTSQVTKSHMLNAGIQSNYYDIDVDSKSRSITSQSGITRYHVKPFEFALYIQDKMEFEGMIANVGLRMDVLDIDQNYHTDPFIDQTVDTGIVKAPVIGRLQPRVGISFPISVNTVFHLNYGTFLQRPSFQYYSQYTPGKSSPGSGTFGNATLKPQSTTSYDVGVTQSIGEGITFDASGYYKNVTNQVEQAIYFYNGTAGYYTTYINRDYADIRGFRLALTKHRGFLTGSINYQYGVATGKSSAPGNAVPVYDQTGVNTSSSMYSVPLKDNLLDFDRTHNLIVNISYQTDEKWGFNISDFYPLGNLNIAVSSTARSGRPYTYNSTGVTGNTSATMNMRFPAEYNTNLKITKKMNNFFGAAATIYFEVFNLLDQKILNYGYITSLSSTYADLYHTKPIDDPDGIRYTNGTIKLNSEISLDQAFLIYSNSPRSFNLGITVEF